MMSPKIQLLLEEFVAALVNKENKNACRAIKNKYL
jgi:hypothetical protein